MIKFIGQQTRQTWQKNNRKSWNKTKRYEQQKQDRRKNK